MATPPSSSHASRAPSPSPIRVYEDDGDQLMTIGTSAPRSGTGSAAGGLQGDHITLLPDAPTTVDKAGRIRVMWGQQMVPDLLAGRYRAVVCGVNADDNSHGVIAQLVDLTSASQWTANAVTSYARMFTEAISIHAAKDREPYVLKYDLDSLLILALLRPKGRDCFTIDDLSRGFQTIAKMLHGRRERLPVASVSFLGARSNRLVTSDKDQSEPAFETVLRTMYDAGFRGDVYPASGMWSLGNIGVFPSYPFPEGLSRMRSGGF